MLTVCVPRTMVGPYGEVMTQTGGAADQARYEKCARQIRGIDVGAELERPEVVMLGDVWQVPVGRIVLRELDEIAARLNEIHAESPGLLELEGYQPVWNETVVACPECGTDEELMLRGEWGRPATFVCECGHEWGEEHAAQSTAWLQQAIVRSLEENGPGSAQQIH